jgi:alpha-tubulin suppressor-like RCC1 family protein
MTGVRIQPSQALPIVLTPRSLRILLLGAALAVAQACADPTGPGLPGIDGIWDFTEELVYPGITVCSDTGSFVFHRRDSTFTGLVQVTGSCNSPAFTYVNSRVDSIDAGVVSGRTVRFNEISSRFGIACRDTAALSATSDDSLSGTATCGGGTLTFHAERGGPLGSIAVVPLTSTRILVGAHATLEAVMRTPSLVRVFGRPLVWSSDAPGVATVSPVGVATAVAGGTAIVTATAEGLQGSATVTVPGAVGLVAVGAGNAATCALNANGEAYCWGNIPGAYTQVPQLLNNGLTRFTRLSMGSDFACGLTAGGSAYCWGRNDLGQLGNGLVSDSTAPVPVAGGLIFASIDAGGDHACGVTSAGVAWCWGANDRGQLGDGTMTGSRVPVTVAGGIAFASVSAGGDHTCGLTSGGAAWCWGPNSGGQVGDGTSTMRLVPTAVAGGLTFSSLDAGYGHTCAVAGNGAAWCWGFNGGNDLGTGTIADQHAPAAVAGGLTFLSVAAGLNHSCGIATGGAAWCWGTNSWGQLGTGLQTGSATPIAVTGGLTFATISAGVYEYSDESHNAGTSAHTCGVTTGRVTWCWGDNLTGQLGIDSRTEAYVPMKIVGQP